MIKRLLLKFFFTAHPLQVLLEMSLLGLVLLGFFHTLSGSVVPFVFSNGAFFFCAICGAWAVVRIRFLPQKWIYRLVYEIGLALIISLTMGAGMDQVSRWLGWRELWVFLWGDPDFTLKLLWWTGVGYFLCRIFIMLYKQWNHLQRKHLIWSLTHAHLKVVLLVSLIVCLILFWVSPFAQTAFQTMPLKPNLMAFAVTRLLLTIFPSIYLYVFSTLMALVVILPLSALFSFLFFRQTTCRLNDLMDTTRAFRAGDYQARARVTGEDEVTHLQNDFNGMAASLQKTLHDLQKERDTVAHLLQQRREMTAAVSHELRTPVAVVRSRLEKNLECEQPGIPDGLIKDIEVSYQEILHLQDLIDDLFLLARTDAGVLPVVCQPVDLVSLSAQVVETLQQSAWNGRRVTLILEETHQKTVANADEKRLKQILVNLLRNGINHTLPGGVVAVSLGVEAGWVHLWVRDSGSGISPQDLPYIWDRFYQGGHPQNGPDGGTGLGLSLVKELTEAMGGRVDVQSQPGEGASFEVILPAG
jgi:signal transduction histidine kinase